MNKFLTLVFLITIPFISFCQNKNVEVKWGPTNKLASKTGITGIIGEDPKGFYAVRSSTNGKKHWLERYNNKMTLEFSEELLIPKKGKSVLTYETIYYIDNQLILLVSHVDKKLKKSYAFAYPISKKGVIGKKFKLLDEIKMEGRKSGSFDFTMSIDSTKILVYHNEPYDKYDKEEFSYKVFDSSLNLIWEKDIALPYRDKYFIIQDYEVDNNGNVYMQAVLYPERGEKKDKTVQANKYKLVSYNYKTDKISEHEIKLPNKWINEMSYDINEDQKEITVSGFYSDDKKMQIKGVFYMAMDKESGNVRTTSIKEFDKQFMAEVIGERKAEKGKGLSNAFDFKYFLTKKDGGAYLIAEKYYIVQHTSRDSKGNTTTYYTYHYDDIIVVSVNNKGEIDWVRKIEKTSHDRSYGYYLSFAVNFNAETNDLNIVFNDNPKNIELYKQDPNKLKDVGNLKKSVAVLVTLNEEGNMTRTPMFSAKELDKIILRPKINSRVSDTEVITFGIKGKNYKFGKFTFK
jgi:hypothetical protein